MSKIKVCALFRPLNSKERAVFGDTVCIQRINSESFLFKDEKEEEFEFSFDRVFYPGSEQADVYEFLAMPIVQDVCNGINGAIITFGQTGAGKTYSMEGPSIIEADEKKQGLLPRAVNRLFEAVNISDEMTNNYTIKLSMVEIYMEKVRDLFDLSKDNIQIKESKQQGLYPLGVTEINIANPAEAIQILCSGIASRAVGQTLLLRLSSTTIEMNMASSRSHCIYIFSVQQELSKDKRAKSGKLMLVDLAGSEKVEKTGAEGRVLEEAKTINKSLSALGNVINALTCGAQGKPNHIPYRDSKLTRILRDALGGNSQTALLCCCSPSPANASESLSTLRFGARAKHIKALIHVTCQKDIYSKKHELLSLNKDELRERILNKLRENLKAEDVELLEELFMLEGIFFDPYSVEEVESAYGDITSRTISSLEKAVNMLTNKVEELTRRNVTLKARLKSAEMSNKQQNETKGDTGLLRAIFSISFDSWIGSHFSK